jgi:small subunit ribosomal protein S6
MRNYEVTFIVDPTLSSDEVSATVQKYADMITAAGYTIVHTDEMGLRQLAYDIKRKHSGVYFCIEFAGNDGQVIDKMELSLRRDEKILRFLTVALDKFAVQFNVDKRAGKIGKKNRADIIAKKKADEDDVDELVEADADLA